MSNCLVKVIIKPYMRFRLDFEFTVAEDDRGQSGGRVMVTEDPEEAEAMETEAELEVRVSLANQRAAFNPLTNHRTRRTRY